MRLGVDVGGTFTDVVLETGAGTGGRGPAAADDGLVTAKVLTTADAPERGVLEGVEEVAARAGAAVAEISSVVHGTTLATNALIQRRGAFCAFVTTAGFRDVIETRTESRFEQYDLDIVLPPPIVERRHRYTVTERMGAEGQVLIPFDEDGARALAVELARRGYEAVAVGFMHSYRNPAHERRFRDILAEAADGVAVSISSEVSPQMRELERFTTVCANAYVQPAMAAYLRRLADGLRARGMRGPVHMIHSGGGLMSLESAARFPVRLVESGPAGGAIFAADTAARHGLDRALSYDMGGTTAKICLITDGAPRTARTFEVARTTRFKKGSGMTVSIPVIDMIEIGAGGGSVTAVDRLGRIRVGPDSAGADPGPACYGRGGDRPTVTDADLVLGRLTPETFGAAGIDLDSDAAARAIGEAVGGPLSLEVGAAAVGVSEMVDENMANAARVHAVENGKDLSGFTMIAFGGAAPLHAVRLAQKLGIDEVLVPPGAGVGSAIGFLRAPFAYEAVRSHYVALDRFDPDEVNAVVAELVAEASSFVASGVAAGAAGGYGGQDADDAAGGGGSGTGSDGGAVEPLIERQVYMRYAGQGWEIPVEIDSDSFDAQGRELLAVEFTKAYESLFGRAIEGLAIEAVSWSVKAWVPRAPAVRVERASASGPAPAAGRRRMFDTAAMAPADGSAVERSAIGVGGRVDGPAAIVEPQTTTVLSSGHTAVMQPDGCLLIRASGPAPAGIAP